MFVQRTGGGSFLAPFCKIKVKLGQGTFLAWHFPVEKAYLVHTAGLVDKLPNMFTLSNIIEWSAFKGTSISNGNISALKVCFYIFFINIDKLSS